MRAGTDSIKVLLVDDDPFCRALLRKALSKHGFEILTADNGRQAFDVIRQQGPSLVITDVIMPEMDGLELCRLIRASAEVAFVYVIILSGRSDREDITKGFDAGADDYIVKPLDQNDLFARLKSAERIIRLEAFYREHTLHLHKVNAEVAVMNGRLERLTLELECARKDAETKTEVVKSFLADTSHEIRSPMTSILGYAEMLLSEGDLSRAPRHRVEAIEAILGNSRHLLGLLNDLLDISKIDAGRMGLVCTDCSPRGIAEDVRALLAVQAEAKHLQLSVEAGPTVPHSIRTDARRLQQVLVNLVNNAIKYTEEGAIRIVLDCLPAGDAASEMLQIQVIDSGIGMDPEDLANLFQRFVQVERVDAQGVKGTGLGLSISREFARLLGGDLTASSRRGTGSTFTVTIPVGSAVGAEVCPQTNSKPAGKEMKSLAGINVLLAEDAIDSQRVLSFALQKASARAAVANDGKMAVELALAAAKDNRPYDVILLDMQLPIMDGYAAARRLRLSGYQGVILALTGASAPADHDRCREAGCDDVAVKPIEQVRLVNWIHGHVFKKTNVASAKPVAADFVISTLAGEADMADLIEMFVKELPHRISAMQEAVDQHDLENLQRLAHQLKGSAGGYGFQVITDAAKQLEQSVKTSQDVDNIRREINLLAGLCERVRATPTKT